VRFKITVFLSVFLLHSKLNCVVLTEALLSSVVESVTFAILVTPPSLIHVVVSLLSNTLVSLCTGFYRLSKILEPVFS